MIGLLLICVPHEILWANPFADAFKKAFQPKAVQPAAGTNAKQPQSSISGTVIKDSNITSKPSVWSTKVGQLRKGTKVDILAKQKNWFLVRVNMNGSHLKAWIASSHVDVDDTPIQPQSTVTGSVKKGSNIRSGPGTDNAKVGFLPKGTKVKITGKKGKWYSEEMMEKGDLEGVDKFYTEKEAEIRKSNPDDLLENIGFLRWLERGTLSLDQGDFQDSEKNFSFAERLLDNRKNQSKTKDFFTKILGGAGEVAIGQSVLSDYPGEGYERVLMLNYKSIAYMLQGERKAYNVARRAIDWQNMEKKAFEEKLREAEKDLSKQRKEQSKEENREASPLVNSRVTQDYARMNVKASTVPSAYVNPFGYYVAGMIQEYESYDDWSLRDNARISYSKALELNPGSKVLKKAVKDMKKSNAPQGARLVHVVVADGFVPEKKMLTYNIASGGRNIPIKLTLYESDPTLVHRIEVQTAGGKRLARLSPVADIEAICLRHQKDMEAFRQLKVALAVASSVVIQGVAENLGPIGQALAGLREKNAAPDMRSWMSLPATIQAARLRLKKGVSKLKIVSYNKKGKKLASRTVKISRNSHDFVYTRSLDKQMYAYSSKELWMIAGR